jgi:hypothetical protein
VKFSAPTTANIRTEPQTDVGENEFELNPAHHQHFLEIFSTFTIKGVTRDAILLHLFPFSLIEKAK